jgi:hypothetical protein
VILASFTLQAQTQLLSFTEQSKDNLTAALNGNPVGTVTEVTSDHWTFSIDGFVILGSPALPATFLEPPTESGYNVVDILGTGLVIESDVTTTLGQLWKNGAMDTVPVLLLNVTNQQTTEAFVSFTDVADTPSTVPDSPSTLGLGLLVISVTALLGLLELNRKKRRERRQTE